MVEGARFVLFLSAATLLAVSPGPGMLYVLSRTLHGGRREGFLSAGGTFVGGSVHAVAAGLGLSRHSHEVGTRVRGRALRGGLLPDLSRDLDDSESACRHDRIES